MNLPTTRDDLEAMIEDNWQEQQKIDEERQIMEVRAALWKVETGNATKDDAALIRAFIRYLGAPI